MSKESSPLVPALTESAIEQALLDARGDIFYASQLLGHVTVVCLDRAIRRSERLQTVFASIAEVKASDGYDALSQEQVERDVQRRLGLYRSDALDALHALATMPIDENSAQNQVKLAAAARLAGGTSENPVSELEQTLRTLNEAYHAEAPRIKTIRERIVTFETAPPDSPEPLPSA